jgi:hypothetical protein
MSGEMIDMGICPECHDHCEAEYPEEQEEVTVEKCPCRKGTERDNCPRCEGTGWKIDFEKIRRRSKKHDR